MELNEEQTLAVQHPIGRPACLIAGAGSGKTRVLTERVRWLMANSVAPRRICAITFTNKAAGELVSRLGLTDETPKELTPRVSTIHSLALSAIRKDPGGFGLEKIVSPLDDYDQRQMMKKIIDRTPAAEGTNVWDLLDKIGFHRARGVGFRVDYTQEVHELAEEQHGGYHALDEIDLMLWELFEEEKKKNSVVDFDDMLHLVVRRLRKDEPWKAKIQRQFDHVLMDEAQDTNPVQWEFVNALLAPGNLNMYIVGDMSQSIYGFNGAVPALLKQYSEGWRGVTPNLYRIARNHRSVPEIVRLANVLQGKMTRTIPLKMESWRELQGDTGLTKLLKACLSEDIAANIAAEIKHDAALVKRPIKYKDNVILVRASIQIREIEAELVKRRIPYIVRGGRGLLQTEEVRDLMAYMRLVTNHKDFMALVRAVSVPRRGIGEASLEKLRAAANKDHDGDLLEACRKTQKLMAFVDAIDHFAQFKATPLTALEKVIQFIRYKDYIREKYKREPEKVKNKLENIDRFRVLVEGLTAGGTMTTEDLVFQLSLDRPVDESDKERVERQLAEGKITPEEADRRLWEIEQGAVTISTIHAAKGLEWYRVYVTNIVEGSLPHKFSMGSEDEVEEERRLFYVACTRAKDTLVLCLPSLQRNGPNTNNLNPSRFLQEVGIA